MNSMNPNWNRSVLLAGCLAAAASAWGQTSDLVINQFNDSAEADQWSRWWGSAPQTYEYDASVDAGGQANSGSLKVTINYDQAQYGGDNQFAAQRYLDNAVDGTQYSAFAMDVRFDPSSPTRPNLGDFGTLEFGLIPSDYSQIWLGSVNVASTNTGWVHVEAPIDPGTPKLDQTRGIVLKMWAGDTGDNRLDGTTVLWVDNVELIGATNAATPPTLAIQPMAPGLHLTASEPGSQYQRQSIRTLATGPDSMDTYYSWVGAANPVTYSLTIQSFPDSAHSGFQAHLFLVPDNGLPYGPGDTSIDWNAPDVIFFQIANNDDGSGTGRFMYKTNEPGANTMLWNTDPANGPVGTLAMLSDPVVTGTWSLTFTDNTNVTLTTPGGSTTNFALPTAAAQVFADQDYPVYAYCGVQPNSMDNIGQTAVLSRIQIEGAPTPLDDNFSDQTLNTNLWDVVAQDPSGILQVPPNTVYLLSWAAPATGFELQAASKLAAGAWTDPGLTNILQIGTQKGVLIPQASLPGTDAGFFRLIRQQ